MITLWPLCIAGDAPDDSGNPRQARRQSLNNRLSLATPQRGAAAEPDAGAARLADDSMHADRCGSLSSR